MGYFSFYIVDLYVQTNLLWNDRLVHLVMKHIFVDHLSLAL